MENHDKKECTALILYEKPVEGLLEEKREELKQSLVRRLVHDPITASVIGTQLLYAAITAAAAIGAGLLVSALTPRPKLSPREVGKQSGRLTISAQYGQLIPEFYFGDPGDGLGGTLVPGVVICIDPTNPIAKQVTVSSQQVGKGFGGTQTQQTETTEYYFPFLALMYGKGPGRVLKTFAHADVLYDLYGQISKYEAEAATLTAPYAIVAYPDDSHPNANPSGGYEATLQGSGGHTSAAEFSVQSNGAATRQVTISYRTALSTPMPVDIRVNGSLHSSPTLPTSNEAYFKYTFSASLNDGTNTIKVTNNSSTYNLGLDYLYCFPGFTNPLQNTGVFDSAVGADTSYDPELPPDPTDPDPTPGGRFDGQPSVDAYGASTGTLLFGGGATFAIYPGNTTQLADPTIEAALDAIFGADSTPAYRNRLYEVDSRFFLTRWGGILPNRTALVEHETIRTLAQFYSFQCTRVGLTAYDFSALSDIYPRGYRRLGQRYQAGEPFVEAGDLFDCFVTEIDGVVTGLKKYPASVATLTEDDFGFIDGEDVPEGAFSLIDPVEPNATDLPERVDVKHLDLDRDGEPGLQGYGRQVVQGKEAQTSDYSDWTMTRDEAQSQAQKEVYRKYVEKELRPFYLSWKYMWLSAGNVITANLSASTGFTYQIFITKISGGIGRQECGGILIDVPVYTQPSTVNPHGYEPPIVPIPASSILGLIDAPVLRGADFTFNFRTFVYAYAVPRTASGQGWTGASLYVDRVGWEHLEDFTKPATAGRVAEVNGSAVTVLPFVSDVTVRDDTNTFTVDLYETDTFKPTLESVTTSDIEKGANPFMVGDELIQVETWTREVGFANRWTASGLWRARKHTEYALGTHQLLERFVYLNDAVKPIPVGTGAKGYKLVSVGQSLDDAATVSFTSTGRSEQLYPIENFTAYNDGEGTWGFQFDWGEPDEQKEGELQILTLAGSPTLPNGESRRLTVVPGMGNPVLFESSTSTTTTTDKPYGSSLVQTDYADGGTMTGHCRSLVTLDSPGFWVEFNTPNITKVSTTLLAEIGLADAGDSISAPDYYYLFQLQYESVVDDPDRTYAFVLRIYDTSSGSLATIYLESNQSVTPDRYRIQSSGSEIQFFRNYTGAGSQSLITSKLALPGNLKIFGRGVNGVRLGGLLTYTTYTVDQQEHDFTGTQSSLRVKAHQVSHDGINGLDRDVTF